MFYKLQQKDRLLLSKEKKNIKNNVPMFCIEVKAQYKDFVA